MVSKLMNTLVILNYWGAHAQAALLKSMPMAVTVTIDHLHSQENLM